MYIVFRRYKFSGYEDDIDDLKTVIRQLRKDGFTPFCLFGHSRGANDVLIYSSLFAKNEIDSVEGRSEIGECDTELEYREKGDSRESAAGLLQRSVTPTSITTTSSSTLLEELSAKTESLTLEKAGVILSEKEVEKEVVILKPSEVELDDDFHLLDARKLMIVVAAPRFNMPKMLTTLFSEEQIQLLSGYKPRIQMRERTIWRLIIIIYLEAYIFINSKILSH